MKPIWILRVGQTSTYYRRPLTHRRARTGYSGEFLTRVGKNAWVYFSLTLITGQLYSTPKRYSYNAYVSPYLKGKHKSIVGAIHGLRSGRLIIDRFRIPSPTVTLIYISMLEIQNWEKIKEVLNRTIGPLKNDNSKKKKKKKKEIIYHAIA